MANDTVVRGRIWSARRFEGAEYRTWYESRFPQWADRQGLCLRLGAPASLRMQSGEETEGVLKSVDRTSITLLSEGQERTISMERWERLRLEDGCSVTPATLTSIPTRAWPSPPLWLTVRTAAANERVVRSDSVVQTTLYPSGDRAQKALIAGIVIDAVIVAAALTGGDQDDTKRPPAETSSWDGAVCCPLVYVRGPGGAVLEAEAFATAIAPDLQRTDLARLEHLPGSDAPQTLDIASLPGEVQYIDDLHLLAIDHAPDTEVLPTTSAGLVVIGPQVRPVAATDIWGRGVRNLVLEADSIPWISNPFVRPPVGATVDRDLLEVRFDRAAFGERMHLILRAQNTVWSSTVFKEMVTELQDHLDTLSQAGPDGSPSVVRTAIEQVGGLEVQLWDGTQWSEAGRIWPVGPIVPRHLAHEVDLQSASKGDEVRLRIVSTPGLWTIDYVGAAGDGRPATEVAARYPFEARDQDGTSICAELSAIDRRYYVMPDVNARAEVSFELPPGAAGTKRTTVLSATGWYRILPDRTPTPGIDIVSVVRHPVAVSRFIEQLFDQMAGQIADAR